MLKKIRHFLSIAWILCLVTFVAMLVSLRFSQKRTVDFIPPDFDDSAQSGKPNISDSAASLENSEWQILDAQAFHVGICGKFCPHETGADVWLYNEESNDVWLKLRVCDENGQIIGETGLIKPNEYVRSVNLTAVPQIGATVELKFMAYEPDTYYSAGAATLRTIVIE